MKSESQIVELIRQLVSSYVPQSPQLRAVQDALEPPQAASSPFEAWLATVFPPAREHEKFLPSLRIERSYRAFCRAHGLEGGLSRPAFYRELKKRLRKGKTRYPRKTGDYTQGWWG